MIIENLIQNYLLYIKQSVKTNTLCHYKKLVELYLKDFLTIKSLTQKSAEKCFMNFLTKHKTLSSSSFNSVKGFLNRFFEYAYNNNYTKEKIYIKHQIKCTTTQAVESLTSNEVTLIEQYITSQKKFYSYGVLISICTGMRIGEVLSLKWNDIDFKNKTISVTSNASDLLIEHKLQKTEDTPKTKSSNRLIPITTKLEKLLKELKLNQKIKSEFVVSKNGKRVFVRAYQESFSRLLKRLNIRHYGFHSLRHTFATRCFQNGMDVKTLSEILGHSSPTVTLKVYVHTNFETKKQAMELVEKRLSKQP